MRKINGIIWDMDGVLIDSEGFWRLSMIEQFEKEGIHLTSEECAQTKGRKINEVVSYWMLCLTIGLRTNLP